MKRKTDGKIHGTLRRTHDDEIDIPIPRLGPDPLDTHRPSGNVRYLTIRPLQPKNVPKTGTTRQDVGQHPSTDGRDTPKPPEKNHTPRQLLPHTPWTPKT